MLGEIRRHVTSLNSPFYKLTVEIYNIQIHQIWKILISTLILGKYDDKTFSTYDGHADNLKEISNSESTFDFDNFGTFVVCRRTSSQLTDPPQNAFRFFFGLRKRTFNNANPSISATQCAFQKQRFASSNFWCFSYMSPKAMIIRESCGL
uniref:Uncharacterized protein n=1 Tax=Romanomermis culicivorax TaxID=13658 RepID=A0A915ISY7_ROMCU